MSKKNDNVMDFKSRINDWEEEEEAIMNEIRRRSDDVEVPEGLLPENMMKKIKQESIKTGKDTQKKNQKKLWNARFMRRAVSIVTAAAVCIVALYQLPNIKGTATLTNSDSYSKGIVYGKIENMVKASNQDEIYSKLKAETRYKSERNFGFARDDVSDGKAEASDNSMINENINKEGGYYKDTNEQVEGVSEGDQVKTDGKYIYVASNKKDEIKIMSANKGNVENISKIEYKSIVENNIVKDLGLSQEEIFNVTVRSKEMYINGDMLTLILNTSARTETENKNETIEYNCYDGYYYYPENSITYILSYDISDRNEPKLLAKHSQEGSLNTSRVAEGYLYVISEMYDSLYENMDRLIPYVDGIEAELDSIYVNENGGGRYTVITALEIAQPEKFLSNINVITGAGVIYVSPENIYIAESDYSIARTELENGTKKEISSQDTIINKFKFMSGKLSFEASAKIKGQVDDQFLMDEYDGTLRVVANSWEYIWGYYPNIMKADDYIGNSETKRENLVYVMDVQLNIIGQIDGIAKNENLYSARFMGNTGYFVTYETVDPLFAVDFSDKTNPKIISELKVPGFSTYLHFWEEDKLLGIGSETESTGGRTRTIGCKFSMFDISNPSNVTEENKLVVNNATSDALYDYKSILISKEKNIIGVAMQVYDFPKNEDVVRKEMGKYVIYSYDAEQGFVETFKYKYDIVSKEGEYRVLRGIIINDVLYLITVDEDIQSFDISQNFKPISTLTY